MQDFYFAPNFAQI